ncbi:MAG: VCBS repeat-containing protein [Deltaproteobacteria bacterium]|nr:VCBS repeat-containing protein [Deltaproteobacteria bacterium]
MGALTRPALGDLDGDGDPDLLAGEQDGSFDYLENLSGGLLLRTGASNPLASASPGSDGRPAFGDLDGDGDADVVVGADDGTLRYFANTGSASNPLYVERTGAANPLAGQDVGLAAAPALADLDGDGDLDLVVGESDGIFNDYRNTGSPTAPAFALRTGAANPLNGQSVGSLSSPALGDLDHDGDPDLVAGELDGVLDYYENTGTTAAPAFVLRLGVGSPVDGIDVGSRSAPDLGDADDDGDLDLLVGTSLGTFVLYENRSLATAPVFALRSGAANPLNGEDVGSNATPAFVDLDGDGDEDVVSGETSPVFDFFENTILDASLAAMELSLPINPSTASPSAAAIPPRRSPISTATAISTWSPAPGRASSPSTRTRARRRARPISSDSVGPIPWTPSTSASSRHRPSAISTGTATSISSRAASRAASPTMRTRAPRRPPSTSRAPAPPIP